MTGHAPLAPSDSERWVPCSASVRLQQLFPEQRDESNGVRAEGDACHWVAAESLRGGFECAALVGFADPAGTLITPELAGAAQTAVDTIRREAEIEGSGQLIIEETLPAGSIHAENWGTPDAWLWSPRVGVLDVWDEKYGYKLVEVFENWQLLNYACLILDNLQIGYTESVRVNLHVIQPRVYHRDGPVRTWRLSAAGLRPYRNRLESSAAEAMGPHPVARSGKHCYKCRARHACEAAHASAMSAFEYVTSSTPLQLPDKDIGREYALLKAAETAIAERLDGIEAELTARIKKGAVTGYALDVQPGRLVWNKPAEDVITLGDMLGKDLRRPAEPVTPTQAKAAGLPAETVKAFSVRKSGATKIVPASKTAAAAAFSTE